MSRGEAKIDTLPAPSGSDPWGGGIFLPSTGIPLVLFYFACESRLSRTLVAVRNNLSMCVFSVVISNLDTKCQADDLLKAFSSFGVISSLNYKEGCAAIKYTVADAARLAIQRMNLVPLCGCCLSVSIFLFRTVYKRQ